MGASPRSGAYLGECRSIPTAPAACYSSAMSVATIAETPAHARRPKVGSGLLVGWAHRRLIGRLVRREVESRYRGSLLGVGWAVLVPVLMLLVYTFVFTTVFQARWDLPLAHKGEFALLLFSGLMTFSIFADAIHRAPGLMLENASYIKKVVFPLEVLPWVLVGGSVINALISFGVLLLAYLAIIGIPPLSAVLVPVVWLPLVLATLGLTYLFSAIGVFVRDLRQVIGVAVSMLMFLSPIFYPLSALPPAFQKLVLLSPVTALLEMVRALLFSPALIGVTEWERVALASLLSFVLYLAGFSLFQRLRRGFSDVV